MRTLLIALLTLFLHLSTGLSQDSPPSHTTYVHAGHLLAVPGEAALPNQTLVVQSGVVGEIREGFLDPPAGTRLVDLSDHFVLPGLIDLHTHMLEEINPSRKMEKVTLTQSQRTIRSLVFLRRTLHAGFTTVRNAGGDAEVIFALRDGVASGAIEGPTILACGASISGTGGHGDIHGFVSRVLAVLEDSSHCDGPFDCRRAVRRQIKRGSDWIKITATGGVLSETGSGVDQQLFQDELESIVQTARTMGRKVAAHAHGRDGINAALRAGVATIDHGTYADETSFALFKQTGAYLVPTMLAGKTVAEIARNETFMSPEVREKALAVGPVIRSTVREAHKAGVRIAFGTDSGVSRHGDNAGEFVLLVEAGLTPAEAILSATVTAATVLDLQHEIGTLQPGKAADLIATRSSPLEDIRQLLDVRFVMRRGIVHKHY